MNDKLNKIMERYNFSSDSQLADFLGCTRMAIKRIRDKNECSTLLKLKILDKFGYAEVSKTLILLLGKDKYKEFQRLESKHLRKKG